jgi:hypothetical protein
MLEGEDGYTGDPISFAELARLPLHTRSRAGPMAVADERADGHVLLQPELYVEILDRHGARSRRASAGR